MIFDLEDAYKRLECKRLQCSSKYYV